MVSVCQYNYDSVCVWHISDIYYAVTNVSLAFVSTMPDQEVWRLTDIIHKYRNCVMAINWINELQLN